MQLFQPYIWGDKGAENYLVAYNNFKETGHALTIIWRKDHWEVTFRSFMTIDDDSLELTSWDNFLDKNVCRMVIDQLFWYF